MKIIISFILVILSIMSWGNSAPSVEDPYKLKQRVESADIILTGKMLYIGCFDEDFVEIKPDGPCVLPYKKTKLRYSLRTDKILKGKNTFLKEHQLLQKVFYYIPVTTEMKAEIEDGQQKIFFFKTRDLEPDIIDSINYVPATEREKIKQFLPKKSSPQTF